MKSEVVKEEMLSENEESKSSEKILMKKQAILETLLTQVNNQYEAEVRDEKIVQYSEEQKKQYENDLKNTLSNLLETHDGVNFEQDLTIKVRMSDKQRDLKNEI